MTSWQDFTASPMKLNTQHKPLCRVNVLGCFFFFLNGYIFIIVITSTRCSLLKSSVKGEGQKHGNDVRAAVKWLLEMKSIAVRYCWEISSTIESYWAKCGFSIRKAQCMRTWFTFLQVFKALFQHMKCAASTDLQASLPNPTIMWYEQD